MTLSGSLCIRRTLPGRPLEAGGTPMSEKKRMANLELLRCVAMMMVIVLHYLGKGGLLTPLADKNMSATGICAWVLEAFCIVAVNAYMFISGYFLCESTFKPSRLIGLWLQVEFYSVVFGLLGAATGVIAETTVDTHYYLTLLFPISMEHYWFLTAYLFLYLLLPLVGAAVRHMSREQLRFALGTLFAVFCVMKSILPIRLETDEKGYDFVWYLVIFLTAAYLRKYGCAFLEKRRNAVILYFGGVFLILLEAMCLRAVFQKTGSLERMLGVSYEYNHLLPFLAALGLFWIFMSLKIKEGLFARIVRRIAPHTLGVYLLHENLGLRYSWQNLLGADRVTGPVSLILGTALAVLAVFTAGIIIDLLRAALFRALQTGLRHIKAYRKAEEMLARADESFRVSANSNP